MQNIPHEFQNDSFASKTRSLKVLKNNI